MPFPFPELHNNVTARSQQPRSPKPKSLPYTAANQIRGYETFTLDEHIR